jgi:hypothetical protein
MTAFDWFVCGFITCGVIGAILTKIAGWKVERDLAKAKSELRDKIERMYRGEIETKVHELFNEVADFEYRVRGKTPPNRAES